MDLSDVASCGLLGRLGIAWLVLSRSCIVVSSPAVLVFVVIADKTYVVLLIEIEEGALL